METPTNDPWERMLRNRGYRPEFVKSVQEKRRLTEAPLIAEKAKQAALERAAKIEMLAREAAQARKDILARKASAKAAAEAAGYVVTAAPIVFVGSRFTRILLRASKVFGVSPRVIKGDRRPVQVVMARQFVMYWAARTTNLSLPQIGRLMGKDHTTVLHGKKAYVSKRKKMGRTLKRAG